MLSGRKTSVGIDNMYSSDPNYNNSNKFLSIQNFNRNTYFKLSFIKYRVKIYLWTLRFFITRALVKCTPKQNFYEEMLHFRIKLPSY